MKDLGFIGLGEASLNIIQGIQDNCQNILNVYDINASKIEEAQHQLKFPNSIVQYVNINELVKNSSIIIVAVPGKCDEQVFQSINKSLFTGKLFLDICTSIPSVKKKISCIVNNMKGVYIDAAVMGSIPKLKNKTPIYISGKECDLIILKLQPYGFCFKKIGDEAGIASTIKLCRSIYMKGIAALSVELEEVCMAYNVTKEVYDSLASSFDTDDFKRYTKRFIEGTYKHCLRRKEEISDALKLISDKKLDGTMTKAALMVHEKICMQKDD